MKKLMLATILGLAVTNISLAKYKILERCASNGGNNGYRDVCKTLKNFSTYTPGGQPLMVTGYSVECDNPGNNNCAEIGTELFPVNSPPPDDFDEAQIAKMDELMIYAKESIKHGVLSGNHYIKVQVEGESYQRIYSVEWTAEDATGLTSNIVIYRDNI